MERNEQNPARTLSDMLDVLRRFRWRFILPLAVVTPAVLAAGMFLPRKYQAEATFERRNDMVLSEIVNRGASQSFQNPRASLTEEVVGGPAVDELMKTLEPRLVQHERETGADIDREGLRAELSGKLNVKFDIASESLDRVRLTFVGTDPVVARLAVNGLVEGYLTRSRSQIEQRLRQSSEFFQQEVHRHRDLIERQENQQLTFEIDHAVLLPESPDNIQTSLVDGRRSLSDALEKRDAARFRVDALKRTLAATPEQVPMIVTERNPELRRLEDKLREYENNLALFVGVYQMTEKHPDLAALRQQIADAKAQIAAAPAEVVTQKHLSSNPHRREVELMLTNAVADEQALARQVQLLESRTAQMSVDAEQLFPVRADYRKLSRQIEETHRQLAFWEDNYRRVTLALAAEDGDRGVKMEFVKPCEPISKPISPDLSQVMLAAAALGLLAGAVGAFMAHRADESFGDSDKLAAAVKLPVFGAVSEIISRRQRRLRTLRNWVVYPVNGLALASVLAAMSLLLQMSLHEPESFRQLKEHPARYLRERLGGDTPTAAPPTVQAQARVE